MIFEDHNISMVFGFQYLMFKIVDNFSLSQYKFQYCIICPWGHDMDDEWPAIRPMSNFFSSWANGKSLQDFNYGA